MAKTYIVQMKTKTREKNNTEIQSKIKMKLKKKQDFKYNHLFERDADTYYK
jgi:hypothetical protein